MTVAELFGVVRSSTCWCCGGLGLCADDWGVVERCVFCHGPTELTTAASSDAGGDELPSPGSHAPTQFRNLVADDDIDDAVAALERAIGPLGEDDD